MPAEPAADGAAPSGQIPFTLQHISNPVSGRSLPVAHHLNLREGSPALGHDIEVQSRLNDPDAGQRPFAGKRPRLPARQRMVDLLPRSRSGCPASRTIVRSTPGKRENGPSACRVAMLARQRKGASTEGTAIISRVAPAPFFHGVTGKVA